LESYINFAEISRNKKYDSNEKLSETGIGSHNDDYELYADDGAG
jgi:hypothetical protein